MRILIIALLWVIAAASYAELKVGDMAPNWQLMGSDGVTYELEALRGQYVVIAFFPKAFTGG